MNGSSGFKFETVLKPGPLYEGSAPVVETGAGNNADRPLGDGECSPVSWFARRLALPEHHRTENQNNLHFQFLFYKHNLA